MLDPQTRRGFVELVALLALVSSATAMSIDMMLPALQAIGVELRAPDPNAAQQIISVQFLGMALALVFFGPLSDRFGRKAVLMGGFGIFLIGTLISYTTSSFSLMLLGRVVQGIGLASPRIVSVALTRDLYEGRMMARVNSLVMTVFMLVPILAPALGQAVLNVYDWRMIFAFLGGMVFLIALWAWLRLPETLPPESRIPLRLRHVWESMRLVLGNRVVMIYTFVAGCVFAMLVAWLSVCEQVIAEQYGYRAEFPYIFGSVAFSLALVSILNAKLVLQAGMRRLSWLSHLGIAAFTLMALLAELAGLLPFWALYLYLTLLFCCFGFSFGNVNALAMQPLGARAGIGAAVIGSVSTLMSAIVGGTIAALYDGTMRPVLIGFFVLAVLAIALMYGLREEAADQSV